MALVQAMGRHRSHGPAPTKRKVVPLARKQPNRRCTCGCVRPGRYLGRLEINGEAHHLGYFATKQERQSAREAKRRELEEGPPHRRGPYLRLGLAEYLSEYEETHKLSSLETARSG